MASDLDKIAPPLDEEETASLEAPEAPEGGGEDAGGVPESPPHTVPHGAFHEERQKRQALERDLQAARDQMARQQETLNTIFQRTQQPAEPTPDVDEDPVGYMTHQIDALQNQVQEMQGQSQQQLQQQQMERERQHFVETYATDIRSFQRDHPDFNDAYQHVAATLDNQLAAAGWTDPAQREMYLRDYEARMAAQAWQTGKSAGEQLYEFAKSVGYKPSAPKMDALQAGAQAAQSLSSSGRTDSSNDVSLERLSELDGEDFDKAFKKLFG